MNKIGLALILITLGIFLLLKNSNLLPDNFWPYYNNLARHYWPVLIILLGVQLLIKEKFRDLARLIFWLIVLLLGLWFFSQIIGENNWVI
ncbi:MAG: LiaI-LiaF-like domain-containing protein [Bacillota bacterium]